MNKYIFGGKSTADVKCEGATDAKQYETTADAESEKKSESGIGSIQIHPRCSKNFLSHFWFKFRPVTINYFR